MKSTVTWVASIQNNHQHADRLAIGGAAALDMVRDLADILDERSRAAAERRLDQFDGQRIDVLIDEAHTVLADPQVCLGVENLVRYGRKARIFVAVNTDHPHLIKNAVIRQSMTAAVPAP